MMLESLIDNAPEGIPVTELEPISEEIPVQEEPVKAVEEKKKSKIDARKMIIYSEIMKPKFKE